MTKSKKEKELRFCDFPIIRNNLTYRKANLISDISFAHTIITNPECIVIIDKKTKQQVVFLAYKDRNSGYGRWKKIVLKTPIKYKDSIYKDKYTTVYYQSNFYSLGNNGEVITQVHRVLDEPNTFQKILKMENTKTVLTEKVKFKTKVPSYMEFETGEV